MVMIPAKCLLWRRAGKVARHNMCCCGRRRRRLSSSREEAEERRSRENV
jgi:hypothetical protein